MLVNNIKSLFNCCQRRKSSSFAAEEAAEQAQKLAAKREELNKENPLISALTKNYSPVLGKFLEPSDASKLSKSSKDLYKRGRFKEGVLELDLSNKKDLDYNKVIKILEKYPNIKHLNLSNTNVNNNLLAALAKCNQLETLNLSGCRGVTDVSALDNPNLNIYR